MIPILENAVLNSSLDCQNFNLLNVRNMTPVPVGLVDLDNSGLNDPRVPPIASVTNDSVAEDAGIVQSKLDLNEEIPGPWLSSPGHTPVNVAGRGDMVERIAQKGVPGGYAALDANLKVLSANVTPGAGAGTVNTVGLNLPVPLLSSATITSGAGTLAGNWDNAPDSSYLGVNGPDGFSSDFVPSFLSGPLPSEIVPALDAAKFTSGTFAVEQLPVATGVEDGGLPGLVPDPGQDGDPEQYLGRDMQWHTFAPEVLTQPTCGRPYVILDSWRMPNPDEAEGPAIALITVRSTLPGSSLFIRINTGPYKLSKIEHHGDKPLESDVHDTIEVRDGDRIWAYVAKTGYNNSDNTTPIWKVVTPLTEITGD